MDTRRVIHLINLLYGRTSGHEEDLAGIYTRALDENDEIIRLKALLDDYEYYGVQGHELFDEGRRVYNQIYATPNKALSLLTDVKHANEAIESSVRISEDSLHSPYPVSDDITVIKQKDKYSYMSACKMIASMCTYLAVLYSGVDHLKSVTWNDKVGIQEMLDAVNNRFLPALNSIKKPSVSWVITRKRMGGKALFDCDCYFLSYEDTSMMEGRFSSYRKEMMSTHSFLNIDAYELGKCDIPLCWGVGNIISVTPQNALALLQKDVATKLRAPRMGELTRKMPTPVECAKQLSDGRIFCIKPEDLLLAMNQWHMGHEINKRKASHNCLFCGKYISSGQLVCPNHFTTEI